MPNLLHFEMAKEAVLRGKHVIVEKPMTANERQAEELCALAKKQGVFLFEAITTRYQSNYQFIKWQSAISANIPENMTVSRMEKTFLFLMQSRQVEL